MKCENCGSNHDGSYGSGRFCSKKCARGYATKNKRKEINDKVSISLGGKGSLRDVNSNCINCGKELYKGKKYCSTKCQHEYQWKMYCKEVEESGKFPNKSTDTGSAVHKVKRYLIETRGHRCEKCGGEYWQGNNLMPLWVDHIDGTGDNWNIENLRLICPNCDFFSNTYCGRNKGNGRRRLKQY